MKKISSMVMLGLVLTASTSVMADDVADITATMKEHFVTFKAGDAAGHIAHHMAGATSFGPDGSALTTSDSLEEATAELQADFDEGYKFDLQLENLNVTVYGDMAVVTSLQTGTVTLPDGTSEKVNDRRTAIVVRDGSEWKEVHTHISNYVEESTD
ncbi:MAG: nuclear transport factor 2 family protein [Proteobacteria bacterium]|nr:nuclear transport factor 2 family protein [Pseudomonadota bacterium]